MKIGIYVLSVLTLIFVGVAAALWLAPLPVDHNYRETRFGLHEERELVMRSDRNGNTQYFVEDSGGQRLFDIPVSNCLLDVRFRDGRLHFREKGTGRTGFVDRHGKVTFDMTDTYVNHEKFTREQSPIATGTEQQTPPPQPAPRPRQEADTYELDDDGLRRLKADHPFFREAARILSGKLEVSDEKRRRIILNYCEHFRMAYTTKDIDFLRQIFSEKALIIVGNVVKTAPDRRNGLTADKRVTYYLRTKSEYLSRLSRAFAANKAIDVKFSDFSVMRHPTLDGIYGVSLRQRYSSDQYSDDGWLFLLWDFRNEDMPLIHVRTWQPAAEVNDKDDVINMSDFNLE